jgi:hypothetical protein
MYLLTQLLIITVITMLPAFILAGLVNMIIERRK